MRNNVENIESNGSEAVAGQGPFSEEGIVNHLFDKYSSLAIEARNGAQPKIVPDVITLIEFNKENPGSLIALLESRGILEKRSEIAQGDIQTSLSAAD